MPLAGALAALGLPELVVAVALLLAALALAQLLVKPVTMLLSGLPLVGGRVAAAVEGAAATVYGWEAHWLAAGAAPLIALLSGLAEAIQGLLSAIVAGVESIVGGVQQALATATQAQQSAEVYHQSALTYADQQGAAAEHYARTLAVNEAADRAAAVAQASAATLTQAQAYAEAQAQAAEHYASVLNAETQTALQAGQRAEAAALQADVAQVDAKIAALDKAVAQAAAEASAALTPKAAPQGLTLTDVESLLATEGLAAIPAVVTQIATEVETMRRECVTPTCNAITPQLPVLNALADGLLLASVVELAGQLIGNPSGAPAIVEPVVGGLVSAGEDILSVVGVRV